MVPERPIGGRYQRLRRQAQLIAAHIHLSGAGAHDHPCAIAT